MFGTVTARLKRVVQFREFPFGTAADPSMREFMAPSPWEKQDWVLEYLRSGEILAYPLGADLPDWFDRACRANPVIGGEVVGGATPMTDGVWIWPAGLIYFIEKYNVRASPEFLEEVARRDWRFDREAVRQATFDYDY